MQSKNNTELFKESFPDAKKLTDKQRKNLLRMLNNAFVDLRSLAHFGKNKQAFDLADAFHNLPVWLNSEVFSFEHFRMHLESYSRKHPPLIYNYLEMLGKIVEDEDLDGFNDYDNILQSER